jgi:hypothetical protein
MSSDHDMSTSGAMDDMTNAQPEDRKDEMSPQTEHHMDDMTSAEAEDRMDEMDRPDSDGNSGAEA